MYTVGLSYKTFKGGKPAGINFFKAIKVVLDRTDGYEAEMVDIDDPGARGKQYDLVVSFSYYGKPKYTKDQERRKDTEELLNYKDIIFIESPVCQDLLGTIYRLTMNTGFFYKNELPDCMSEINRKRLRKIKKPDKHGDSILLLLQNPLQYFINLDYNHYEKHLNEKIKEIREHTDKQIIVRYKPSRKTKINFVDPINNLIVSDKSLHEDCKRCYKCISHATNAVSTCVFYGMDIISLSEHNLAYKYSEKDFRNINTYNNVDYAELETDILSCGYSIKDLKSENFIKLLEKIKQRHECLVV